MSSRVLNLAKFPPIANFAKLTKTSLKVIIIVNDTPPPSFLSLCSNWSNLDDLHQWLMVREVSYEFQDHDLYKGAVYSGKWNMAMPHMWWVMVIAMETLCNGDGIHILDT